MDIDSLIAKEKHIARPQDEVEYGFNTQAKYQELFDKIEYKKGRSAVVSFCVICFLIIVLLTLILGFQYNSSLVRENMYLQRENSSLKTLLMGKAHLSGEIKEVRDRYEQYCNYVIKQLEEKEYNHKLNKPQNANAKRELK